VGKATNANDGAPVVRDNETWIRYSISGLSLNNRASTQIWDSAYQTATSSTPIVDDTYYAAEFRHDGTNVYCRVNGVTAQEGSTACTTRGGLNAQTIIGESDGSWAEMFVVGADVSLANRDYFIDYVATRYGLSL
jgi:hypothetical protein